MFTAGGFLGCFYSVTRLGLEGDRSTMILDLLEKT
jgi:hypothetical protein